MDEEYALDRATQAAGFVIELYRGATKKPKPDEVQEMLCVFYKHLKQDDVSYAESDDNIIILTMPDK